VSPVASPSKPRRFGRGDYWLGFGALAGLALLLVVMTLNAVTAARARKQAEEWQVHTLNVLLATEEARSGVNAALRGERGFLITGDPRFLVAYRDGRAEALRTARLLDTLTRDNPHQAQHIRAFRHMLGHYLAVLERTIVLTSRGDGPDAVTIVRRGLGRREVEALLAMLDQVEREERELLASRAVANKRAGQWLDRADVALYGTAGILLLITVGVGVSAVATRRKIEAVTAQLRWAAATDELTGLPNRRCFLKACDDALAPDDDRPVSLALIDIDHFKRINDQFGHQAGDEVLRSFATTASAALPPEAVLGRLGGEEFGLLLPGLDHAAAGIAAERVRDAVSRHTLALDSVAAVTLTISIGVARRLPGEARDRLISRADAALYQAKKAGRNRTRLAA
jgi:diguanylate cyclase (GGDEF)-like protein